MSDSGESDVQSGDIHGQRTPAADTGALVSVHVDNVEVSRTEDNEEDEPEPGDQDNNRRRLNRRVDSAMSEQVTASSSTTIDGLLLQQASRRQKRPTGPRRINTAPVNRTNAEAQALLAAPSNRVQGIPVPQQSRNIKIEHVAVCGLCQGKSMEDMWLQGGSLQMMDNNESIIVERAARFEYLCGVYYLLTFILVTNRRFVVKQLWKYCGCNIQTEEESHHFSDLQHVGVERGIGLRQARNRILVFAGLSILSQLPVGSSLAVLIFEVILTIVAILYGIYNLVIFLYYYRVNFLVVDVAKTNIVGSWKLSLETLIKGRSYLTVRMPLPVDACFEVMNELLKKHPSLPTLEDDVY